MGYKSDNIIRWLVTFVMLMGIQGGSVLHAQYLLDDEQKKQEEPELIEEKKDEGPVKSAFNITADRVSDIPGQKCAVRISWEVKPGELGEYVVARSNEIIDTREKVHAARVVKTLKADTKNSVIDTDCTPGSYYYVVVSKDVVLEDKIKLYRDVNYTTVPVAMQAVEESYRVKKLRAEEVEGSRVRLDWERVDKTGMDYTVYRSRGVIDTAPRLKAAERVNVVTDAEEFVDETIPASGVYYYAVTAKPQAGNEDRSLVAGQNYTSAGVRIKIQESFKLVSITASVRNGGVLVSWKYRGALGDVAYRLFRSDKPLTSMDDIATNDVIANVEITDNKYLDAAPPEGKLYYGLIPEAIDEKTPKKLVPGVNITRNPVTIRVKKKIEKKIEKKIPKKKEEKIDVEETDDIDRILKRTFFKGRYHDSIKQLQDLAGRSDNERVTAKARLFIGRSYIELRRYRKALDYLLLSDVKKHFPKQAEFWEQFALTRIKNY